MAADTVTALRDYLVPRPRLERRMNEALHRRLTTVVAGSGFGKSALTASWAPERAIVWRLDPGGLPVTELARGLATSVAEQGAEAEVDLVVALEAIASSAIAPDQSVQASMLASSCCDALRRYAREPVVAIVDDVHCVASDSPAAAFLETLARQAPPALHLVLLGRRGPPFRIDRLRGQGEVLDITAADLAFREEEVAEVLAQALGSDAVTLAGDLHDFTGGWPAAVRLAVETLRATDPTAWPTRVAALARPGGALYDYLALEVLANEPPEVRALIEVAAALGRFRPELCEALGVVGAADTMVSLLQRGLFVEGDTSRPGWFSVHALLRAFVGHHGPHVEAASAIRRRAAAWLRTKGLLADALDCLLTSDSPADIADLLEFAGETLLASGRASAVLAGLEMLPSTSFTAKLLRLRGDVLRVTGDWDAALDAYVRSSQVEDRLGPALAWRMGAILYLRGDLGQALSMYGRAIRDGTDPVGESLLTAWTATAHWGLGDVQRAHDLATAALTEAGAVGDAQAQACAHTVLAMVAAVQGNRSANEVHYARARSYSERAGDLLQLSRIRTNHGAHLCYEGRFTDALAELDAAVPLTELAGFASFGALARYNRGYARYALGRLEEAVDDFEASRALYEAIGSSQLAYPLRGLGDVYRARRPGAGPGGLRGGDRLLEAGGRHPGSRSRPVRALPPPPS